MNEVEWQPRLNTASLDVAVRNLIILRRKFPEYKFTLAVSTNHYIFLDCDDKSIMNEFVELCREICKEYQCNCYVFETPNGYHALFDRYMSPARWRAAMATLLTVAEETGIIDAKHIEASLRRGYVTLRLNQISLLVVLNWRSEVVG